MCSRVISSSAPNGSSISSSGGCGGQRPRDRHPLLHAARQLPREVLGEVGQPDQLEHLERPRARRCALSHPVQLERQLDVLGDRAPLEQPGLLERDAVVLVEPRGLAGRLAVDQDRARRSARSGWRSSRSSVDLPQPDGPISETNSPGATVRSMSTRASTASGPSGVEHLGQASDLDASPASSPARVAHSDRLRGGCASARGRRARPARPSPARARPRRTTAREHLRGSPVASCAYSMISRPMPPRRPVEISATIDADHRGRRGQLERRDDVRARRPGAAA